MEYFNKKEILLINLRTIDMHGGNFLPPHNFLHEDPLDYLLDAVQEKMFGNEMYPTISDKAGLYMSNIISNHIFQDGNKRTGLESALSFLELNGHKLKNNLSKINFNNKSIPAKGNSKDEILIEFTLELASGKLTLEETQQWFKENIKEL
mgnify:CR=1 FL=1